MLTTLAALHSATSACVDDDRRCIWVTQANGAILRVDMAGGSTTVQTASSAQVSVASNDQLLAFAGKDGTVSVLDPDDPAAPLQVVSRSRSILGQLGLTAATRPTAAVVTHPPSLGRLLPTGGASLTLVNIGSGTTSSVPLAGLSGIALDGRTAYVARNTGSPLRGEIGVLRGTLVKSIAAGLPPIGRIGLADSGAVLLAAHLGGQLSAVRPSTGQVHTVSTTALAGALIEAHGLADGRIVVLTAGALSLIDSLADLSQDPTITPFAAPIFVGSWVEIGFDLGTSGLSKEAVHFEVPDGLDAGFVSYTRNNGIGDPVPLLVVGGKVGLHKVVLVETATATELASAEFEITDHWTDSDTGPAGFYMTDSQFDGGSGWGGGPSSPQNLGVHPHTGTWRSLVLMVDTSSRRWPTDAVTMTANQNSIMGHVTSGSSFGGQMRSARQYYEENSAFVAGTAGLTLSVKNNQVFGPVNLPNAWTDYFEQTTNNMGVVVDDRWSSKGGTLQTIISRAISDGDATTADFTNIDVLIVVVFSADATGGRPARFVWPHANDAREFLCGTNAMTDRRSFGYAFVPLDFDVHDGRQMHTTLSHELGHTLSLPDLYDFPIYSPDVTARITGDWDMMAGSRDRLPHYSLSNKMRMGWLQAGHLKLYNFQGSGLVAENVTLHASELGPPPAGRFKGIEIRLGNGWNYYVEYRAEQGGQVSDDLLTDRRVVITDVTSDSFVAPIARPPILFVHNDIDGDGPLIGNGADFEERDPGTQLDLKVEVVSSAADNAVVRVSYGSNGRPEPGIRPWTGGPNWQSPDIEVRNDRANADPARYFNMPWAGHDNTVVARVRNSGDLLARGVVVDFFVTEYSSGDGPWIPLGTDTKDVGPGAVVEFTAGWAPPADENRHYCIIVRIRLYQDPANLAIVDQNIYNNEARSNYTRFVSASASPSSRVGATVMLANPFDTSTHVYADVKKTHPEHRVFIDHQWLRVDGKDGRPIRVWDEALWGTPEWAVLVQLQKGERVPSVLWELPNRLSIAGWAQRPFESDCGAHTLTGGVGLRVDAGRATAIKIRAQRLNYVAGQVVFVDDGSPVTTGGTVLIEVTAASGRYFTVTAQVGPGGAYSQEFQNPFGEETKTVEVHYLGAYSAAPCTTGPVAV